MSSTALPLVIVVLDTAWPLRSHSSVDCTAPTTVTLREMVCPTRTRVADTGCAAITHAATVTRKGADVVDPPPFATVSW
jgi:hypothetical protein